MNWKLGGQAVVLVLLEMSALPFCAVLKIVMLLKEYACHKLVYIATCTNNYM